MGTLREGASISVVARELLVSKRTVSHLKQAAAGLPPYATPPRKVGTARKKITTARTDAVLKRELQRSTIKPIDYRCYTEEKTPYAVPERVNQNHSASPAKGP